MGQPCVSTQNITLFFFRYDLENPFTNRTSQVCLWNIPLLTLIITMVSWREITKHTSSQKQSPDMKVCLVMAQSKSYVPGRLGSLKRHCFSDVYHRSTVIWHQSQMTKTDMESAQLLVMFWDQLSAPRRNDLAKWAEVTTLPTKFFPLKMTVPTLRCKEKNCHFCPPSYHCLAWVIKPCPGKKPTVHIIKQNFWGAVNFSVWYHTHANENPCLPASTVIRTFLGR